MARREVSAERSQEVRDRAERIVLRATRLALREFLEDVLAATLAGLDESPQTPSSVSASLAPDPVPSLPPGVPPLGTTAGRWAAAVDDNITEAVHRAFASSYSAYTDASLSMESPALEGMEFFAAKARDRLVQGTYFGVTVYEDAYDQVRQALALSSAQGWSRPQLAQHIAASLAWETDGPYWRKQLAWTDGQIDSLLDPLGPPGTPAREWARLNDPQVQALRNSRNLAIRHLDAEKSIWQTRATLIARTEATGAANYGALSALAAEGWPSKEWVATRDSRTRKSHARADGQVVELSADFKVGSDRLQFPGDTSGKVEEVANCRCTMVGSMARSAKPPGEELSYEDAEWA